MTKLAQLEIDLRKDAQSISPLRLLEM